MRLTALVLLVGCASTPTDSADPSDSAADTADTSAEDVVPTWSLAWADEGVTLSVSGASGPFTLGLIEQISGGWAGEDGLVGPAGDGRGGEYDFIHDAMDDRMTLAAVTNPDAVVVNTSTLVSPALAGQGHVAAMLVLGDRCWEQNDVDGEYDCDATP